MKIVVLGAGLVGAPMAMDLAKDNNFSVTLVDKNSQAFDKILSDQAIECIETDLSTPAVVTDLVKKYDLVISAVPGFMGFRTLQAIIEAGRNVVDIAFFPEDPFQLNQLAKEKGVTAIVDCGVAPGMSHILTGYVDHLLDSLDRVRIYVGGLPVVRTWPYEYKAVFSPADVIEEYVRPARLVENGKIVVKPALSEGELIEFPAVGTLEAFNSDGLRTLTETINVTDMAEKTLRYPGHIELMKVLRNSGFFNAEEIDINGKKIIPLELTSKLLETEWKLTPGEHDVTVMKIIVEGSLKSKKYRYTYNLVDYYDQSSGIHSMARTTGYTATVVARLLADKRFDDTGIIVPEFLGRYPELVKAVLTGLEQRGVIYTEAKDEL